MECLPIMRDDPQRFASKSMKRLRTILILDLFLSARISTFIPFGIHRPKLLQERCLLSGFTGGPVVQAVLVDLSMFLVYDRFGDKSLLLANWS